MICHCFSPGSSCTKFFFFFFPHDTQLFMPSVMGPCQLLHGVWSCPLAADNVSCLCVYKTHWRKSITEHHHNNKTTSDLGLSGWLRTHSVLAKCFRELLTFELDLSGCVLMICDCWCQLIWTVSGCNQLYSWALLLSPGTVWKLDVLRLLNQLLRWWGRTPGGLCGWLGTGPKWYDGLQEQ